jgi:hypothetical protein
MCRSYQTIVIDTVSNTAKLVGAAFRFVAKVPRCNRITSAASGQLKMDCLGEGMWLPDHTTKRRKLSDLQGQNPMVLAPLFWLLSV